MNDLDRKYLAGCGEPEKRCGNCRHMKRDRVWIANDWSKPRDERRRVSVSVCARIPVVTQVSGDAAYVWTNDDAGFVVTDDFGCRLFAAKEKTNEPA